MDIFVARQPIFDTKKNVFAYELLYRDSSNNQYTGIDGNKATAAVLANSFMEIGYDTITSGKKAFVNFTEELITMEAPTLFPNDLIVIEILEDVAPTNEIIEKCKDLKSKGYTLALDDFEYAYLEKYKQLLKIIDIVKVDWVLNSKEDQIKTIYDVKKINHKVRFLAEKIETNEDYEEALKAGYSLFQGYFFSKPIIVKGIGTQNNKVNFFQILKEISDPNPNFEKITQVIEMDPVLTLQLLKLINSVAYRAIQCITSVKEALIRLGTKEIKKWLSVLMLRDVTKEKPIEIIRLSLVRAYFMELMANETSLKSRKSEAFLFGLFSMIEVLFNSDKEELLKDIPLNEDLKDGLLGKENAFTSLYNVVIYYENGDWDKLEEYIQQKKLGISSVSILNFYYDAINLANQLIED